MMVAVAPETVHTEGVAELKLTGRPEFAVAVSASCEPSGSLGMAAKVMVWAVWCTSKLCETEGAAAKLPLPDCEAVILHRPDVSSDAAVAETVQIVGVVEAKLTGNPELAVAESETAVSAVCVPVIAGKAIVCVGRVTVKLRETAVAA
jgi:hypothetical protein